MRNGKAFVALVALLALAGLVSSGCIPGFGQASTPTPQGTVIVREPTPAAKPATTPATQPTASPGTSQAIVVLEPKPQQVVRSPVRVAGHARVFEGTVRFEVIDAKGAVVGSGFATATAGAPEVGYYSAALSFSVPARDEAGLIRVFGDDPRDGKRVGLVEIPVILGGTAPAATATRAATASPTPSTAGRTLDLKVYFSKSTANDIQFVSVTRTIPHTYQMGRAALAELLKGPTEAEKRSGLETSIPAGVKINSLRIENGTAYADFDQRLQEQVGGSVRTMAIRRQITLTLQQFSTVQNVIISIDGRTEDILQP